MSLWNHRGKRMTASPGPHLEKCLFRKCQGIRNIALSKHLLVNGVQPEVKHCRHLLGISGIPGTSLPRWHHHGGKSYVQGAPCGSGGKLHLGYPYHPLAELFCQLWAFAG